MTVDPIWNSELIFVIVAPQIESIFDVNSCKMVRVGDNFFEFGLERFWFFVFGFSEGGQFFGNPGLIIKFSPIILRNPPHIHIPTIRDAYRMIQPSIGHFHFEPLLSQILHQSWLSLPNLIIFFSTFDA